MEFQALTEKKALLKLQKCADQTDVVRLCEKNLKMRIERTGERKDYINRGPTLKRKNLLELFVLLSVKRAIQI